MAVSLSSRSDRRRPLIASRTMRRLAAPVTCGGRRGPLSLAAAAPAPAARHGVGRPRQRPTPSISLAGARARTAATGQGPSHRDALTALAAVHRSVVAHLSAQPTRVPVVAAPRRSPSRTRISRPPAA